MADDGTAAAAERPAIFAGTTERASFPRVGRLGVVLVFVCFVGLLLTFASQTIVGRYAYYRAQDAAWAARKEVRQTVDALHNWWHHVKKTVAQRDKKRTTASTVAADAERWVGTIDPAR